MTAAFGFSKKQINALAKRRLAAKQICEHLGCSRPTLFEYLRKFSIELRQIARTHWPKRGERFDNWRVIRRSREHPKLIHYLCKCRCGTVRAVSKYNLINNKSRSCGCKKYPTGSDSPFFRGHGEISLTRWNSIRRMASDRKIRLQLTIEQAWELFVAQDRQCKLSGIPLSIARPMTASLDRIDSKLPYVLSNVQWVHKDVNTMKWNLPQAYFLATCKTIAEHQAAQGR